MSNKNTKFIDIRLITCRSLLVQILKLLSYIQYSLENTDKDSDITITLKIKNKYKSKLLISIDDNTITPLAHNGTLTLGE